jgi:hypothetical protein
MKDIPLLPAPSTAQSGATVASAVEGQLTEPTADHQPSNAPDRPSTFDLQPSTTGKRKRGAPFGNQNRLLHGFFSDSFTRKESKSLDTNIKGEFHDEISLLYVLINRTAQSINDNPNVAPDVYLNALRTITQAIARIESLRRSQRFLYSNQTTIEKAMQELAYIPPDQD